MNTEIKRNKEVKRIIIWRSKKFKNFEIRNYIAQISIQSNECKGSTSIKLTLSQVKSKLVAFIPFIPLKFEIRIDIKSQ